ncbi:MAG: hypothetical protein M3O90_02975 [Actinomycetota bacterium]|nr:hypothetical protein [Actinomycetota bacterium]
MGLHALALFTQAPAAAIVVAVTVLQPDKRAKAQAAPAADRTRAELTYCEAA